MGFHRLRRPSGVEMQDAEEVPAPGETLIVAQFPEDLDRALDSRLDLLERNVRRDPADLKARQLRPPFQAQVTYRVGSPLEVAQDLVGVLEITVLSRGLGHQQRDFEELGLVCFLKTTGGKGLHIVTPIQRTQGWEEVKSFAKMVADHLVTTIPQRFTSNMSKRVRKGKIFIDYLRNARGATAIAAYSTRAKPGAPVSVPIAWDELSKELPSDYFTVMNVPARLKRLRNDPWEAYGRSARRVTAEMGQRLKAR